MRKIVIYMILLFIPTINNAGLDDSDVNNEFLPDLYTSINLGQSGLDRSIFDLALKGYKKLDTTGQLINHDLLTIADYSQSSTRKRFYVIDLKNRKLLFHTYVAHGRNSGEEYARTFSNEEGSLKSSLGFFVTSQPKYGASVGYALLLQGIEKGINDNAERRAIIMHGGDYVSESFIQEHGRLGRSLGCPALPVELSTPVIETIKGGSCLFLYSPDSTYIHQSSLLN